MQRPNEEQGLSRFEELDRDPPEQAGHSLRRELLLGLLILVAVAGWAGFDWLQNQQRLTSYGAAGRAAAARDWEEARARFIEAGDYADSPGRAAEASRNIADRDRHYEAAAGAFRARDWVVALRAAQAVEELQPGYRDTAAIAERAGAEVYHGALEGVVARRAAADPPGLYHRGAGGWDWLDGSDPLSEIRGVYDHAGGSTILYDVPAPDALLEPLRPTWPAPEPRSPFSRLPGRQLIAATLRHGGLDFTPILMEPGNYDAFLWGDHGGWGIRHQECAGRAGSRYLPEYACAGIVYQARDSAVTETLELPGDGWRVAALAPGGSGVLLADLREIDNENPTSALYLATPGGRDPRLLHRFDGIPAQASFSQDARYVLLSVVFPRGSHRSDKQIVLVDLLGETVPRVLAETSPNGHARTSHIIATFLRGPRSHQVLLLEDTAAMSVVSIAGIQGREPAQKLLEWSRRPRYAIWAMAGDDGSLLVGFFQNYNYDNSTMLHLDPQDRTSEVRLQRGATETLSVVWSRAGRLIYMIQPRGSGDRRPPAYQLRSIPLQDARSPLAEGVQLFSGPPRDDAWPRFSLGAALLGYVEGDELRARSYDGVSDVALERGVTAMYDLGLVENWSLLR